MKRVTSLAYIILGLLLVLVTVATVVEAKIVKSHQKISATEGGFTGASQSFGTRMAPLGDLDGDGVADIAVGTHRDHDGGFRRGAVWILFLNTDGTVKAQPSPLPRLERGPRQAVQIPWAGLDGRDGMPAEGMDGDEVPVPASPVDLVGLTDDNMLVLFASDRPAEVKRIDVSGLSDGLLGIDYRPADGRLYAISEAPNLYTLDVATGSATFVCTLTLPFDVYSGFDFNPKSDRLRLLGANGRNLRSHPEIGATAADAPLAYAEQDPHSGTKPTIVAAAYTNSVPNAPSTKLFDIDSSLDLLVLQDPPNDGVLETVGPLGVDFDPAAGFDIVSDGKGRDRGFAASHSTLYAIDLETGKATRLGTIGDGRIVLIGLAVQSAAFTQR